MSQEARDAWTLLVRRLNEGPLTLLGVPGPNRVLLDRARRAGALEGAIDDASAPTARVVVPMTGATPSQRRSWERRGHELIDLTLPSVRRAHVTLGLLAAEGCRLVIAGHAGDAECRSIAGDRPGVALLEDADQAAALPFAPKTGMVMQTGISGRRATAIGEALRFRFRDSPVQALDTRSPALVACERALAAFGGWAELVLIVADPADASGRALYETARWLGLSAQRVGGPEALAGLDLSGLRRIGLSAGLYTTDEQIAAVEAVLAGP